MKQAELTHQHPDSCIVMFARAPVKGQVKTRLIPALGEQGALDMHVQLMNRQMAVLNKSTLCPKQLWVDQMQEHSAFVPFEGAVKLQKGISLGDKMFYAAEDVLRSSSQVVIIGSDCPGIDESYLELALQELDKSINDVVLGPAMDGGYVLIAMKHPHHEIFQDIDWGSELVLQQTINRIQNCDLGFSTLPALRDIDTAGDLESLL
ncbi:TIGR04282 family arsenosugar biosynthesis glycosyltransferase [Gammaproteobacteria bacterium]|mgnify:CR=1 FL=1|nr:TIGR04282 family arsenosugar biosynthesis glycosyltransferase [Gammaproteobacteria bacterium]